MKHLSVIFLAAIAAAQTPSTRVPGSVTSVNPGANQISIKTASGDLTLTTTDKTQILRAAPGVTDPKQWPKIALADISAGDEVLAYYRGTTATSLVVRTKADLGELAHRQMEDWRKRGASGTATAIDPAAKTISMKHGQRAVTVQAGDKTVVRRYSPDSAKPADAKPATLADIKPGDQVNVLGNRSEDGATIAAEEIYAGTFRQLAATIDSIDASAGEMRVTDLATKKPLTIRVTADTTMKKLPEQAAQILAKKYQGGSGPIIERAPVIHLADLKPKDAIMVSTTSGSDPTKVTAVMLLAGVEPVLTAAPASTRDIMSGWNLEGGGEGQ